MSEEIVELLLFIGCGLYLMSSLTFLFLFLKTLRTKDGVGLIFLKTLTFCLFLGSFIIFGVRIWTLYGDLNMDISRIIASINPLLLIGVGLYLNYLFHNSIKYKKTNNKNIIKKDTT